MTSAKIDRPEQVMARGIGGHFTKHALASLLKPEPRRRVLDVCAVIERSYTDANVGDQGARRTDANRAKNVSAIDEPNRSIDRRGII